jgi:hypothetical protein
MEATVSFETSVSTKHRCFTFHNRTAFIEVEKPKPLWEEEEVKEEEE